MQKENMSYKKFLAMLFLGFTLCSCGIKGDLYLPDESKASDKK
jgi:predicted small lipoprotein YifL